MFGWTRGCPDELLADFETKNLPDCGLLAAWVMIYDGFWWDPTSRIQRGPYLTELFEGFGVFLRRVGHSREGPTRVWARRQCKLGRFNPLKLASCFPVEGEAAKLKENEPLALGSMSICGASPKRHQKGIHYWKKGPTFAMTAGDVFSEHLFFKCHKPH